MKTYKDFTDDVNGVIVGGDYGQCWVTYQGRMQGRAMYPSNKIEAMRLCNDVVERLKKDCGEVFDMIYPNEDGWKFHFNGV